MDGAGGLTVRPVGDPRRSSAAFAVDDGGVEIARVETGPRHGVLHATGVDPADPPTTLPPAVWPDASARRAAAERWRERNPMLAAVTALELAPGSGHRAREVVEAVGDHLVASGIRRLDVRVGAGDPLLGWLQGPTWIRGPIGSTTVASRSLQYPWGRLPAPDLTWASHLPMRVRRLTRRLSAMHPSQVPELARVAGAEVAATVRYRSAYGGPHVRPTEGAPPGAFAFGVSRYRTIRAGLALVPPALRSTGFADIGCGDGRVLREALDAGFPSAHGREQDQELGTKAVAAIGRRGTVTIGDALVDPLPDDLGVLYLNNPFDADCVARLARMTGESLERRPRPMFVIYVNPRTVEPFIGEGFTFVQCTAVYAALTIASPVQGSR